MKTLFSLLMLLILVSGCSSIQSSVLSDSEKESIRKEVDAAMASLFNVAANDPEKIPTTVEATAEFQFVLANANEVFNASAFAELANEVFPQIEKQEFETITQTVTIINRDVAICAWHGKNKVFWKDGKVDQNDDYWSSFVFQRINGELKIVYVHESVFLPDMQVLPETAP